MKRVPLIMAVGALLLVLSAGVALAHLDHIRCADENPGSDLCRGNDESDHIIGSGSESDPDEEPGTDDIYADDQDRDGRGDADVVEGRWYNDIIRGQEGNDEIGGGEDDDSLSGGSGSDKIADYAENDSDTVYGGRGNDSIVVREGDGDDWVSCGKGTRDRVWYDEGDTISRNCERRPTSDPRHSASALPTQLLLRSSTLGRRRRASRPRRSNA